eukprot:8036810-Lingulodinium_polyedra.AAC.1
MYEQSSSWVKENLFQDRVWYVGRQASHQGEVNEARLLDPQETIEVVVAAGFLDAEANQTLEPPHLAEAKPSAAPAHCEPSRL